MFNKYENGRPLILRTRAVAVFRVVTCKIERINLGMVQCTVASIRF